MSDLPGITIVLAVEGQLEGEVLTAIYSAEHQDYPSELIDTHIVWAIDGVTVAEAQRVGVKNATTDWVAIMYAHDDWVPDHVSQLAALAYRMPFAADVQVPAVGMMYKKDYWLRSHA